MVFSIIKEVLFLFSYIVIFLEYGFLHPTVFVLHNTQPLPLLKQGYQKTCLSIVTGVLMHFWDVFASGIGYASMKWLDWLFKNIFKISGSISQVLNICNNNSNRAPLLLVPRHGVTGFVLPFYWSEFGERYCEYILFYMSNYVLLEPSEHCQTKCWQGRTRKRHTFNAQILGRTRCKGPN